MPSWSWLHPRDWAMANGYTPPTPFREWLSRVFRLHITMHEYSPSWDHFLRMAIVLNMVRPAYHSDEPNPRWFSDCTVMVGDKQVWVGNYPYAYGTWDGVRPSYTTIKLLRKVHRRMIKENEKELREC